ncbi:MAG: DUF3160 domain-containing protein [Nannocystaceae bacterium]|nr:DUF3160 domain-containing protein [Nannocystaceae bacterium]
MDLRSDRPSMLVTLVFGACLVACSTDNASSEPGPVPDPDLDPDVEAFLREYEEVRLAAAQMQPEDFLETYPQPEFVTELGYDPSSALGLDAIEQNFALSAPQHQILAQEGFVVMASDEATTPEFIYHQVYDADLPVLITTDSIAYALHRSFDSMLAETERSYLALEFKDMLAMLHTQLGTELSSIPAPMNEAVADLDVYLTVSRSLLSEGWPAPVTSVSGGPVDDRVAEILDAIQAEAPQELRLFGGASQYDYSQMKPRGHYEDDLVMQRYFRSLMWLGRTELAMVTFPEGKTVFHRAAFDAAAILDHLLMTSGARPRWQAADRILHAMVGEQDSMSPDDMQTFVQDQQLSSLAEVAKLSDDAALAAIMGRNYGLQRIMSQIMFTDPQDPQLVLPRVYLLFGQRFTLDSHVFNNVTYDRLVRPGTDQKITRMLPDELDAQFVLGNNTAAHLLAPQFDAYPYEGALHELRFLVESHPEDFWSESFYNGWLAALRALNAPESERSRYPAPMRTEAWQHKTLATQAASRAELRHDTLLYAKQSYSSGISCEFIDAYVEPAQGFYLRMKTVAVIGSELSDEIEAAGYDFSSGRAFFENWASVMDILAEISRKELDRETLTGEQIAFLGGAIERDIIGCGEVAYDGWYASLFFDREDLGDYEPTIADVHTAPTDEAGIERGWVLHAATGRSNTEHCNVTHPRPRSPDCDVVPHRAQ